MNDLLFSFYKTAFLSIVRGNHRGVVINAKPLYYITIIDLIDKGEEVLNNKISFSEILNEAYLSICKEYQSDIVPTPLFKPYYYSKNEHFYHLKFKQEPPNIGPSAKFIRDNIEYAYLDNALWDLLQEPEVRQQLREALVTHFLTR